MKDYLIDNKFLYNIEYKFVKFFRLLTKIIILLYIIGFIRGKPTLINKINIIMKILIGLFLVYRFNGHRSDRIKFTDLDREACYLAGTFLLIISFGDIMNKYLDLIHSKIYPYTHPIISKIKKILYIHDDEDEDKIKHEEN
jgi:hypothetical protein